MLSRGLPPAPQTGNSPVPRATPRIHHCPSWKPASQSRLTQGLLSLFQCNHIPRHCSLSCSCDLHFFFPSCMTLHEDVFQCRCSRRSIPARPASRQQRQPCSRFLHLLTHVSSQTEFCHCAGAFFPSYISHTTQLTLSWCKAERGGNKRPGYWGVIGKSQYCHSKTTTALQTW